MSGARKLRRSGAAPESPPGTVGLGRLVRPEFQPTLPALLRGRGRRVTTLVLAVLLALLALPALTRMAGAGEEPPEVLVHRQPAFSLLVADDDLRQVAPRGDEHLRLEGRGPRTAVSVSVAPLPRTLGGAEPGLAELPIEADRMIESLERSSDNLVVLAEGRARVNGAPGYQVRHRSGPEGAPRFGHDVLLVPAPPLSGPGLRVTLVRRNRGEELGPGDRRIAYAAKRAFRSVRFGTERP
jgi:hypothetical protein